LGTLHRKGDQTAPFGIFEPAAKIAGRTRIGQRGIRPRCGASANDRGLNVQGGVSVSLAQHSAVKGIREGRRLVLALQAQAKNAAIELKHTGAIRRAFSQSRIWPISAATP
jgi:hypothetical protein